MCSQHSPRCYRCAPRGACVPTRCGPAQDLQGDAAGSGPGQGWRQRLQVCTARAPPSMGPAEWRVCVGSPSRCPRPPPLPCPRVTAYRASGLMTCPARCPSHVASPPLGDRSPGFYVIEDEPPEVLEMAEDGVTPLVVAPRIELTLEWLVESPPPEHTWEEPPIFYDGARVDRLPRSPRPGIPHYQPDLPATRRSGLLSSNPSLISRSRLLGSACCGRSHRRRVSSTEVMCLFAACRGSPGPIVDSVSDVVGARVCLPSSRPSLRRIGATIGCPLRVRKDRVLPWTREEYRR